MTEDQLNETFDALFHAVRRPAGPDLSGVPAHARREEPPAPKELTQEELKDAFDPNSDKFDPKGALSKIIESNYGGLLSQISGNATMGLFTQMRNDLPDFGDYEADVRKVLDQIPPTQVNQGVILDTYFKVKGLRSTQELLNKKRTAPTTVQPTPRAESSETPKLSSEEESIARTMFRNSADPVKDYLAAQAMMDENKGPKVPGEK